MVAVLESFDRSAGEPAACDRGSNDPLISVVMPCRNEAKTVGGCVRRALEVLGELGLSAEVVVCDNGSTDDSGGIARQAGARVVRCDEAGYGNAVRAAIDAARGEILVMADADGSHDLGSLPELVRSVQHGADMVVGNRFAGGIDPGAMPWLNRRVGNPGLSWLINRLFHTGIGDTQCGLRAFTRTTAEQLALNSTGMELASEMLVKAARLGLRTEEVPTRMFRAGRDRAAHLLPGRDGWRHLKFLLMFSPLHLFLIPGATVAGFGMMLTLLPAWGMFRVGSFYMDIHWMVLGILLLLIGIQIVQFGVIARLYTVLHRFPAADRALEWLRRHFSLERGLIAGALMFAAGFAIDVWIAWEWIRPGPPLMEIRAALLATAAMAVGTQTAFFSFLYAVVERGVTHGER